MIDFQALKELLREKGYKLTPQRRAILDIIINNQGEHLSTEEIYDKVRCDCPDIGLATVYRTLQLLSDINVLSKMNLDDGLTRYEMNIDEDAHHHHHLICTQCSKIEEVIGDLLEPLEERIESEYGFKIQNHKLKFFGLCKTCQQ